MSLLRLIRFPNLIIVALTQWLLYDRIILPALHTHQLSPTLPPDQFYLFIAATVCVTAGGYIINDIVDVRNDLINKPHQVIIGRRIAASTAYWLYFCINLLGFLFSMHLAFVGDRMPLLFLFPMATIGLLLYSIFFKKRPLAGNLLVSFYTAGVALLVWIAEAPALAKLSAAALERPIHLLAYYAVFAFLANVFREIVKDLEDMRGDAAVGARTIPIAWGIPAAKQLASAAAIALLMYLLYFTITLFAQISTPGKVALILLILLIGTASGMLLSARQEQSYHRLSQFIKIIMLWGILLLLIF